MSGHNIIHMVCKFIIGNFKCKCECHNLCIIQQEISSTIWSTVLFMFHEERIRSPIHIKFKVPLVHNFIMKVMVLLEVITYLKKLTIILQELCRLKKIRIFQRNTTQCPYFFCIAQGSNWVKMKVFLMFWVIWIF